MSLDSKSTTTAEQAEPEALEEASAMDSSPPQGSNKLDPEYAQWLTTFFPADATPPPLTTIQEMRPGIETMLVSMYAQFPPQPTVTQTSHTVRSYDGAPIKVTGFHPPPTQPPSTEAQPAILHFHGGGHCASSVSICAPALADLAARSGLPIFSVDYRLAPEHPSPAALEDGYAALAWLSSSAASLGIDAARLALMGESSGGGLAAGIALLARDRGLEPRIRKMVLVYPMLDDRCITLNPAWDAEDRTVKLLRMSWEAYVGGDKAGRPEADVSVYAAPGRAQDLGALPDAYVEVGGLDEFRDECERFAGRLRDAGSEVEFCLWPGVPHGFDVAREIEVTKRAMEGRVRALRGV